MTPQDRLLLAVLAPAALVVAWALGAVAADGTRRAAERLCAAALLALLAAGLAAAAWT